MVGENNSSESGAIMCDRVEFEDYLGNVGKDTVTAVPPIYRVIINRRLTAGVSPPKTRWR